MKYKYLIKKIIEYTPKYYGAYPESKPIGLKLLDMGKSNEYLVSLIERNSEHFKKKYIQFNMERPTSVFETIYCCLDFDITEEYVWWKASQNMKTEGYKQWIRDLVNL